MKVGLALAILANYIVAVTGLGALLARLFGWNFSISNALSRLVVGLATGLIMAREPDDDKALSLLALNSGPLAWTLGLRHGGFALLPWLVSLFGLASRLGQFLEDESDFGDYD